MISWFVEQSSSYAADLDFAILLIAVIVGFWFLVAEGVFFYFILKFKKQPGKKAEYIDGTNKAHKKFISYPHYIIILCDIVILWFAVTVWMDIKQELPPADATVNIIAQQWAWTFEHPGKDGKLGTPDDIRTVDELHVEVDKTYHFRLTSKDVMHSFSVPVFRLKQDAIPGREITGWFKPTKTGEHDIQCAEMCGIGHGIMGARIHIEDAAAHQAWVNNPLGGQ